MTRDARVALLTNFIPPYRLPELRALTARVAALRVIISTPMEGNRAWRPDWEGLDVVVQRTLTVPRVWRHPVGFRERLPLHVPLDTRARLKAFDPDIVISAELGARSLQAVRWARSAGRPIVLWATLSERTERGRGRLRRLLRRYLLDRAEAVIVNGESGARYVAGYGYPEERIYRVPYTSPVNGGPGAAAGEAAGDGTLELLYVGQTVARKGVGPLIAGLDRWARERDAPVRLTVVGAGEDPPAVPAAGDGPFRVRGIGPVPFEALAAHYQGAHVFAFPTLADEWGLVVNEAMACGLPVLGSVHSQAVTELVEDGRTGWRYDPEAPNQLEAAMDRIAAAGPARIRAMGAAARERVAALTPESTGERLAAVLDDILEPDRRRP